MMNDLFFWKNWRPAAKALLYFCMLPAFAALGFYGVSIINGQKWAIEWETETQAEKLTVPLDQVQKGIFDLTLESDNYVLQDTFLGTNIQIQEWPAYVLLILVAMAVSIALAVAPTMKRLWYVGTMGLFLFVLMMMKTEQLLFLGRSDHVLLLILMAMYLPASFYFHAFRQDISFVSRLLTFLGITVLSALLIGLGSEVAHPFLHVVYFGLPAFLVIAVFTIVLVAVEIVRGLLYLATSASIGPKGNNVLHFSLITAVYLLNVLLVLLHNRKVIDWDFVYVNEFLLLVFSLAIGFWGYYKRDEILGRFLPFQPLGAYLYLALATICLTTIAFAFATVNDPLIEMFEDAIVFTHLGLGISFFLYVLINFYGMLHDHAPVHKVVFNPKRMPLFVANLFGIIVAAALALQAGMYPYYQAQSGYYNGIGDLYQKENQLFLSEQYFKEARSFDYQNHRSNYSIASLARNQNDLSTALYYFQEALQKNPTPFAYVNTARIFQEEGMFFDAVFTLQKGTKDFPENAPILNNLAALYAKTDVLDSALYYLEKAARLSEYQDNTQTNLAAIVARAHVELKPDSIASVFEEESYPPLKANLAVQLNQQKYALKKQEWPEFIKGNSLNFYEFTYVYDYTYNQLDKGDTALARQIMDWQQAPENAAYREQLSLLAALTQYYAGNTGVAFEMLRTLAQQSVEQPKYYYNLLGKLALKKNSPMLAAEYFGYAAQLEDKEAPINRAIALADAGKFEESAGAWQQLGEDHRQIASLMQELIDEDTAYVLDGASEAVKFEYSRMQVRKLNWEKARKAIATIDDPNYQAQALKDAIEVALLADEPNQARRFYADLKGMSTDPEEVDIQKLELAVLMAEENEAALLDKYQQGKEAGSSAGQPIYEAKLAAQNGDPKANALYEQLGKDPFNEQGVLSAARYFDEKKHDPEKAYEILVEATQSNPYSIRIKKAYILQSLEMGLEDYAKTAYEQLQEIANPEQIAGFRPVYEEALDRAQAKETEW